MRRLPTLTILAAIALSAGGSAWAQDGHPLSACSGVVGAWLTDNPGGEPSRSLLSFTGDGLVFFADSGQGGGVGFGPFTGGHGAWRCVASGADGVRISASVLDFTLATVDWPNQKIGRLDFDASVDPKGAMTGSMTLLTVPLDGDPLEKAKAEEDADGKFSAVRITAP